MGKNAEDTKLGKFTIFENGSNMNVTIFFLSKHWLQCTNKKFKVNKN